ncbi:MAG: hypothetical protein RJB38_1694 [Pseudomonadota bacterium]|jgi:hypothetical protein
MGSSPSDSKFEATRVDLGDDLLDWTRAIDRAELPSAREVPPPSSSESHQADDEIQSARILMGEGLWDQAKLALHRALVHQPSHPAARALLEEIQERELKKLLEKPAPKHVAEEDEAERVLQQLERDWQLGIEADSGSASAWGPLRDQSALAESVAKQVARSSERERQDLAIGFLQMQLPEVALAILPALTTASAAYETIRCTALLGAGQALQCAVELEARLREEGLRPEERCEMEYLLARAQEQIGEWQSALQLFLLLGDYRDSSRWALRLRRAIGRR